MKAIFSVLTILFFTLIISCGLTDDKESKVHDFLQQKVNSDSKGTLQLDNFSKTNGYEQDMMGMKFYIIEWQGQISVQQTIWKGNEFRSGYQYWDDFDVMKERPQHWLSTPAKQFSKGTIVRYSGECQLQETEQGWRVKNIEIKTWQIISEG